MAARKCLICPEEIPADAPPEVRVHPSCLREHPEFIFPEERVDAPVTGEYQAPGEWLLQLNKRFPGFVRTGNEIEPVTYRTTGSLALDVALGGYGLPRGRVIHLMGREGAGKTRLFELAAIAAQRMGLRSMLVDLEGTFDPYRFQTLGGNLGMLDLITADIVVQRDKEGNIIPSPLLFGEIAFEVGKTLLQYSDQHAYICFDSTGAMVSKREYESKDKDFDKATVSHTARLMSDGLRVLVGSGLLARSTNKMSMFFVSQSRDNVGARVFKGIPPPDKVTGGRALPYYSSVRLEVLKGEQIKADLSDPDTGRSEKQVEIGHVAKVRVRKNKCNSVQGRVAELNFYTEGALRGLDVVGELGTLAIYTGALKQGGSWFELNRERAPNVDYFKIQGKPQMRDFLTTNKRVFDALYETTRALLAAQMDTRALPETAEEEAAVEAEFSGDYDTDEHSAEPSA